MVKQKVSKSATLAVLVITVATAVAATTTTTLPVSANVTSNCLVTASTMAFGVYTQAAGNINQTSTVSVRCSAGTGFNVGLNAGTTPGASVTTRRMQNGASRLAYSLFSNAGRTINWGNTVGTNTVAGTGAGFAPANVRTLTVYGRIVDNTANRGIPAGAYTDTITATVTY
jgi:spore coat protein U-like protein